MHRKSLLLVCFVLCTEKLTAADTQVELDSMVSATRSNYYKWMDLQDHKKFETFVNSIKTRPCEEQCRAISYWLKHCYDDKQLKFRNTLRESGIAEIFGIE